MAGLYAGITFSKNDSSQSTSTPALKSNTPSTASSTNTDGLSAIQRQALIDEAQAYATQQAEKAEKEAAENARKAALNFQPVVRKRAVPSGGANAGRGIGASRLNAGAALLAGGSVTISAPPSGGNATISAPPSLMPSSSSSNNASATIKAPPMELNSNEQSTSNKNSITRNAPPSMTLEEDANSDVNGFRATAAGKKANKRGNKNSNNSKRQRKEDDPSLAWNAEYDPNRPTDYNEYKAYSKRARAERRAELLRQRQKQARNTMRSSDGSDYSDDDDEEDDADSDEERRRRIAKANNRFFAPPTNYEDSPAPSTQLSTEPEAQSNAHVHPVQDDMQVASNTAAPASTTAPSKMEDDGWAAWSATPAVVTEDPFARRLALAQGRQPQQSESSMQSPPVSSKLAPSTAASSSAVGASISRPTSSHDRLRPACIPARQPSPNPPASARGLGAQSSSSASPYSAAPTPPPTTFNPATATPYTASAFAPPTQSFAPTGVGHTMPHGIPLPPHMMASASVSPQPVATNVSVSGGTEGQSTLPPQLQEAQARARAIAAKLASLGKFGAKPASPASSTEAAGSTTSNPFSGAGPNPYATPSANDPIPGLGASSSAGTTGTAPQGKPEDFAKNLMAKYGWTKGQGLGASSQGMVNPLALAGSENQHSKKGKQAQQQQQPAPVNRGGPVGIATAKGKIVSDIKTEKERQEREKYGEPTRVVCLSNMVGREDVDDELVSDVSEEARKLGVLEQCFVHVQPPYVPEDDAVRVFVVFSGLVGAWNAVKAFDGRFFGGRTVRAKFYNEQALEYGALHL